MRLAQRFRNGELWWFMDFDNYMSFPIGRVWKMPTVDHAMRVVDSWKMIVIEGRPYHRNITGTWIAYGT